MYSGPAILHLAFMVVRKLNIVLGESHNLIWHILLCSYSIWPKFFPLSNCLTTKLWALWWAFSKYVCVIWKWEVKNGYKKRMAWWFNCPDGSHWKAEDTKCGGTGGEFMDDTTRERCTLLEKSWLTLLLAGDLPLSHKYEKYFCF